MSDDRATAILPTAAALVCAVEDHDADEIARILNAPGLDWRALAVVLAASVDTSRPLGSNLQPAEPTTETITWERRGLIQVGTVHATPPQQSPRVACLSCGALDDQPCLTTDGRQAKNPHAGRLDAQTCRRCRGPRPKSATYCPPCRAIVAQEKEDARRSTRKDAA